MNYFEKLTLGACYYPEHWPEDLWADDLKRMLEAGITMIRIAEFAWNKIEVQEGVFDFSFFDRFLDLVETTQMKVVFCTPTATPPAWLTEKYPEVLAADWDGHLHRHGVRRHYNYNSPVYRKKTEIIVTHIAEHYGKRKCIIGWQIDNKMNGVINEFYAQADHEAFREYLKKKYGTLEALNEAWGTVFWNQGYTKWQEVFLPRYAQRKACNPHMKLDSLRFYSESCVGFARLQHDILVKYLPGSAFITTNGIFKHVDYAKMNREAVDFISFDSYPGFGYMEGADDFHDRKISLYFAQVRGCSSRTGVMEQQSGPGGWYNYRIAPTARPGQLRLWTFQSFANGADFVNYFRWRTCCFGTEIYWHGILGYDNLDNRRLQEITDTAREIRRIEKLAGSPYEAEVALLRDYDNEWDGENDVWHGPVREFSQWELGKALFEAHIPFSYVTITEDTRAEELLEFKAIFAPHMTIVNPDVLSGIREYVEKGGIFVSGARTGYKDMNGKCPMKVMPIDMNDLFGVEIRDFTAVMPEEEKYAEMDGVKLSMPGFNDILTPVAGSCRVLAEYMSDYYEGQAAITVNRYGKGETYYYGAAFEKEASRELFRKMGLKSPVEGLMEIPEDCELAVRRYGEISYFFLLNYSPESRRLVMSERFLNVLNGEEVDGEYQMKPYDVLVLIKDSIGNSQKEGIK